MAVIIGLMALGFMFGVPLYAVLYPSLSSAFLAGMAMMMIFNLITNILVGNKSD